MKKIKYLLIIVISLFAFQLNGFAASTTLSVSSKNVKVGDSFIVYADMKSAAAWNIHVKATGPVSGCTINQADASADAMDTNKRFSATCKATGEGTITIKLSGDVTSAEDGNAVKISGTTTVTVTKKTTPSNSNTNKPTNNNKPSNSNSNTNTNLSKNNNLKELSVEGYSLDKIDNNHYSLTVGNNVTSIDVKAVAEDSKAKVIGAGKNNLKVGNNSIDIVVTSEAGTQNKINLKITRKEDSSLEDLDSLLKDSKAEQIHITISSDTVIPSEVIQKIKDAKRNVNFNYYDENKKLKYTWIVEGSKIEEPKDVLTTISYDSENKKDIHKASNYAEGLYVSFKQKDEFPKGIKVKLSVKSQFEDGYIAKSYQYVDSKLNLIREDLKVKDGYIEFEIEKGSDYFITLSSIGNTIEEANTKEPTKFNIFMVIAGIEFIVIIALIVALALKSKKKKEEIMVEKAISEVEEEEESNEESEK